ncbi:MAG: substrate-binding domain-containing protein [Gammaproteobacteria bacterium]
MTFSTLMAMLMLAAGTHSAERFITVASTTSTENSGLFAALLSKFTNASDIDVRVIAVGTGQAIKLAANGDADVLFVHHKPSEEKFIADRFGVQRFDVMYNDFVVVGPKDDPAGIEGMDDVAAALNRIATSSSVFVSRGDESGTHKRELSLWQATGVDVAAVSGTWYRETGSGMGATLNVASGTDAYALTDRATWLKFKNKGDLALLVEGDERLFNQYGVTLVNPEKHKHVKAGDGKAFIDWLLSDAGQTAISVYRIEGRQAFFANAQRGRQAARQ